MLKTQIDKKIVAFSLSFIVALSAVFVYYQYSEEITAINDQESKIGKHDEALRRKSIFKNFFVEAKSAYVYDVRSGKVLFEKNSEVPLPLASITKVMTAVVADESLPKGSKITIDSLALEEMGDSGLVEGETWSLKNLLTFTLIVSSNDGARSLANAFGSVGMMNKKADDLNLDSLRFYNPTGLDLVDTNGSSTEAGGYGSAEDVAKLMEYAITKHPEVFEQTKHPKIFISSESLTHEAENTDLIVTEIPNILASKTGYTTLAGGNLAIAFDKGLNEPVIIVVLGSTFDGRFTDVKRLVSAVMETYNGSK